MEFGTYPTGVYIEGDLPNQVAVSTGSTVAGLLVILWTRSLHLMLSIFTTANSIYMRGGGGGRLPNMESVPSTG